MSKNRGAALSKWALRLAIGAPVWIIVCIGLFRLGFMEYRLPFYLMLLGVVLALVALVLSAAALIRGLGGDGAHMQRAALALVLSLVMLYPPLNTVRKGMDVPVIHDISTDLDNPVLYREVPKMRAANNNSLALDEAVMAVQKAHYTDVAPLYLQGAPDRHFDDAVAAAQDMGWEIVSQSRPDGHIEATATTALFGFKDDVVIRLRADNGGTRVDMRSASRVGRTDFGVNAARIAAYFDALK